MGIWIAGKLGLLPETRGPHQPVCIRCYIRGLRNGQPHRRSSFAASWFGVLPSEGLRHYSRQLLLTPIAKERA